MDETEHILGTIILGTHLTSAPHPLSPICTALSDVQLPPGAELVFPSQYQPGRSMMYIKLPGQIKVQHEVGNASLRYIKEMPSILGAVCLQD